jgi:hypothetical protein
VWSVLPVAVLFVTDTQTDITERKLNEETQKQRVVEAEQRRVEAEEAKRQQELLIDITSYVLAVHYPPSTDLSATRSEIPSRV